MLPGAKVDAGTLAETGSGATVGVESEDGARAPYAEMLLVIVAYPVGRIGRGGPQQ